eukprot:2807677-Rhodomonas_salina.1
MSGRVHKQQYPSNPSLDLTLATTSGSGFSYRSHARIENFVGMGVDLGLMLVSPCFSTHLSMYADWLSVIDPSVFRSNDLWLRLLLSVNQYQTASSLAPTAAVAVLSTNRCHEDSSFCAVIMSHTLGCSQ